MSAFQINAPGYRLTRLSPGMWRISSPSGRAYAVEPQEGRCSCPDNRARGRQRACKHLKGVRALLRLVPALEEGVTG